MLSAKAFAGRFCRLFFWRFRLSGETGGKTMETGSEEKEECPLQCCNQHVFAPRKARPFVRLATRLDENFQGGYTPQQIRSAYDFLANSTGLGQTIALITTGLQPNIESDLSFFSSFFSLPAARLTIRRIGAVPEVLDSDWALETTLDVEWAHALAPDADLLLVYAASDRIGDLMQAADLAAGLGAAVGLVLAEVFLVAMGSYSLGLCPSSMAASTMARMSRQTGQLLMQRPQPLQEKTPQFSG